MSDYELILVDGNGTSTLDLVKNEQVIKISSKKGRANQMNAGAKIARCNKLLFLHSDTLLPKYALSYINETLNTFSAGAFELSFNTNKTSLKIIAKVASWRSRLTRLPYGDQAIFVRKDIFEKLGMYEDISLMEDVNLMQKLKKNHFNIKILNQKVITSAIKWEENGIIKNTTRNWILQILYFCKINPNKLAKYYT